MISSIRRSVPFLLLAFAGTALTPAGASAQGEAALAEALAPLLQAEDSRNFDESLFARALEHPEPLVRRTAAMSIGRIGDSRGIALLTPVLIDRDSSVQAIAMFALGLIGDSTALDPVLNRFETSPALAEEPAVEGVTAIAKLGGPRAGEFFREILRGRRDISVTNLPAVVERVVRDSWRLGKDAPASELARFVRDTSIVLRSAAIYTLSRLRSPVVGDELLASAEQTDPNVRSWAVRTFTRAYADTAGLAPEAVINLLRRAADDPDAGVRIVGLRTLATWQDSALADIVILRLEDPDPNVRVQAASTLGQLGGAPASAALQEVMTESPLFAVKREALLSLARIDTAGFMAVEEVWRESPDWRERAVAAQARVIAGKTEGPAWAALLNDRDPRVTGAALEAWSGEEEEPSPELAEAARGFLNHRDAVVRSVAADVVGRLSERTDIAALAAAYGRAVNDSFPEAALSALGALAGIAETSPEARDQVDTEFLLEVPRPESYLVRLWARENWPDASALWGPAYPIETGRTMRDYREVALRYLVPGHPDRYPHVFIETEQRGTLEVELFGPEAPMTVTNFLLLVDRNFFDGNRWHRVVPNFVVQDGDPRGDGWGGP
ncbi:MAG: HEAT repeat domain-containing protein, partial [Gemmatimonadales bacterium]